MISVLDSMVEHSAMAGSQLQCPVPVDLIQQPSNNISVLTNQFIIPNRKPHPQKKKKKKNTLVIDIEAQKHSAITQVNMLSSNVIWT